MPDVHKQFMIRAVELAKKAQGKTYPNPLVGAVLVRSGKIVGEGYHRAAGTPHAESIALGKAKGSACGADLYISLEPCAHYGKTPPCVLNIIKSGVKKVYVAMKDPNPLVNGKGLEALRKSGIKIKIGICRQEAEQINQDYIKLMLKKRCLRA